ncbi:DUF47 family protein [Halocalculus aciditolerans]|uniref:DUF47 family protein n=1 Tax=Halocalculus aciditolerans TaxID=1383812 RepID=A0A830FN77_9EURY|nr:DUF47 family protein [Halocalculus aciditolerans]GGL63634.1 hypothetical protein GCM10009039_21930 [Halocalculus aciditolerans]
MASVTGADGTDIEASFEEFLRAVKRAVGTLPDVVSACRDGDGVAEWVAVLDRLESAADDEARALQSAVNGDVEPSLTGVYLYRPDLLRLVTLVDDIANAAERFARELAAVAPSLPAEVWDAFDRMVDLAAAAVTATTRAVGRFVGSLDAGAPAFEEDVATVRRLESDCDDEKYSVLSAAFETLPTADALLVMTLVGRLDVVPNAAEDVADALVVAASKQ